MVKPLQSMLTCQNVKPHFFCRDTIQINLVFSGTAEKMQTIFLKLPAE